MNLLGREWGRKLVALIAGLALALGVSTGAALADGNNTQCNTNNGVTVCTTDDTDDTLDEGDDTDDDTVDDGGSGNGGNNNDGDGIVNS